MKEREQDRTDLAADAPVYGLSSGDAARLAAAGKANVDVSKGTRSIARIISSHALTLFNAINLVLAILVATTGQWKNMLFMGVVILNFLIGTSQEIRAKRKVDELTILTRKPVRTLRDGRWVELSSEELVEGDAVRLAHGDQVPADAHVLEGSALADESLLTGESDQIRKGPGDELYSGSHLVAGSLVAELSAVGAEAYAQALAAEAKQLRPVRSEILSTLRLIIRYAAYLLIPLGIALFARSITAEPGDMDAALLSTVAAVVGMIPQGLVLLTSTVLAVATTRLAARQVLVQQTYCVETLARVDTVCLDKTGTITSGAMVVEAALPAEGSSADELGRALATLAAASEDDANATSTAVRTWAEGQRIAPAQVMRSIPFDSAHKRSGCVCDDGTAYLMGAMGFAAPELAGAAAKLAEGRAADERLLIVAEPAGFSEDGSPEGASRLLGLVCIRDELRASAPETVRFFSEQGVDLKVISGDDARTVSAIAAAVGIEGAERAVDASTLSDEELADAVESTVVFGRVTPAQKRILVQALQAAGHVVAMTGDGVNDVLALREADCSVAMASGSAAARDVAEAVLADDDFAHMPQIVAEGRRSINNLTRSASLFLVKTVFSAAIAALCLLLPPYPFVPIQMTLIGVAVIGIPSFVLGLEPNRERVTGDFLANVLARSLPASLAITAGVAALLVARGPFGLTDAQTSTCATLITCTVGFALVVCISQPLNPLRICLLAVMAAILVIGIGPAANFFGFAWPQGTALVFLAIDLVCSLGLFLLAYHRALDDLTRMGPLARAARRLEGNHA